MYKYKAIVKSVYDGDTITVDIDLGFDTWIRGAKLRLHGIDTPEMRGGTLETKKSAKEARDFVRERVLGRDIMIESLGKGKYGRYLAIIWEIEDDGGSAKSSLNDILIKNGMATKYLG